MLGCRWAVESNKNFLFVKEFKLSSPFLGGKNHNRSGFISSPFTLFWISYQSLIKNDQKLLELNGIVIFSIKNNLKLRMLSNGVWRIYCKRVGLLRLERSIGTLQAFESKVFALSWWVSLLQRCQNLWWNNSFWSIIIWSVFKRGCKNSFFYFAVLGAVQRCSYSF